MHGTVRHIAIHTFNPSEEWQKSAKKATDELLAKTTPDERSDYIQKNSHVWKPLGIELLPNFGNKCWYTDASNYGSLLYAERFRPKDRSVELPEEDCKEAADNL